MKAYMLIDRSGSMQTNWVETIGAVNAYANGLKELPEATITVAVFDSTDPFEIVRNNVAVKAWKDISPTEVQPRGMTPLFDAIGKLYQTIKNDWPSKVSVVIVTDGAENHSREFKRDTAKILLDELREKSFDVVFIGADFDAFSQGSSLGNSKGFTLNMNHGNYEATFAGLATRSMAYASTGVLNAFTDEDRAKASK